MDEQRKISFRKILQTALTLLLGVVCIVAILSASKMQDSRKVAALKIEVKNNQYHFVDEAQIKTMLQSEKGMNVIGANVGSVDVHKIETAIYKNPWVDKVQAYIDNKQVMHISVIQRIPVARLFDQAGHSFYIDNQLKLLPASATYTHYSTVVTNVPVLGTDSLGNALKAQIVEVVKRIDRDSFWAAQVSQLVMNDDRQFELVPVLGNQRILIGDTSRIDEKFENLYAFYKKVLNRVGWDKYEVLDARFAGQVVASPALQWKAPVDKAALTMNWVESIVGKEENVTAPDMPEVSYVNKAILRDTVVKKTIAPAQAAPVVKEQVVKAPEKKPATQAAVPHAIAKPAAVPVKKVTVAKPVAKQAIKPAVKNVVQAKAKAKTKPKQEKPVAKKATVKDKKEVKKEVKKDAKEKTSPKYIYQGK